MGSLPVDSFVFMAVSSDERIYFSGAMSLKYVENVVMKNIEITSQFLLDILYIEKIASDN